MPGTVFGTYLFEGLYTIATCSVKSLTSAEWLKFGDDSGPISVYDSARLQIIDCPKSYNTLINQGELTTADRIVADIVFCPTRQSLRALINSEHLVAQQKALY